MNNNKKSILVISFKDPDCHCGGVEDYVKVLYEGLSERGWDVYSIFSIEKSGHILPNKKLKKYGIPLIIPNNKYLVPMRKIEFFLKASLFIFKNHKKFRIIHSNGDNSYFPFIHSKLIKIHSFPGFSIQKVNKNSKFSFWKAISMMFYVTPSVFIELIGLLTSNFAVVDNDLLYKRFINFRNNGLVQIYNAIDISTFHPITSPLEKNELKKKLGLDSAKHYAIWVGTDPRLYRLTEAIESVQAIKYFDLLVVGMTNSVPIERVKYLGLLDHSTLADFYKASDVIIHLSNVVGIDLSVLSALASGIPAIVDNINYPLYMPNGFVYSACRKDQIISILQKIIACHLQADVKANLGYLNEAFTPDFMITKYEKLFEGF